MSKPNHWTSPRPDGKWSHQIEGGKRASGVYDSQAEAWDATKKAARADGTEAFLQNRQGQIRERNTYGEDHHPPKG